MRVWTRACVKINFAKNEFIPGMIILWIRIQSQKHANIENHLGKYFLNAEEII